MLENVINVIYFCFFWLIVLLGNGYKDNFFVKKIPTIAGFSFLILNNLFFYLTASGLNSNNLAIIIVLIFVFKVINAFFFIFVLNRILNNSKIKWILVFIWSILFEAMGVPSYIGVIALLGVRYIGGILYVIRSFFMVC